MLERVVLERRQSLPAWHQGLVFGASLTFGLALSAAVLVAAGVPPQALLRELVVQVFLTRSGLAQTLTMATPMVLLGLSAALALRLRFWNIGVEGQVLLGAILATLVAINGLGGAGLHLPLMLAASMLGGLLWIAVPLLLKLRLSVSEVVVTLLLSNVAYLLLQHLLFGPLRDPARNFPTSPVFDPLSRLPRLDFGNLHAGLFVALALAVAVALLTRRSRLGFYGRLVGDNPAAARAAGLPVVATTAAFVLLSGALAGLAGGLVVAGTEYRLTQYVGLHATFSAIVIAVLARFDPLAVVVAAFFVAGVYVAGTTLKVFYGIPEGVVLIVQGTVLLSVVAGQFFASYRIDLEGARATG